MAKRLHFFAALLPVCRARCAGYSADKVSGQVLYLEGEWRNDQLVQGVGRVRYVNGDWCFPRVIPALILLL